MMRYHAKQFGTGFWVLVSVLFAGSVTCFSVAASASTSSDTAIEQAR